MKQKPRDTEDTMQAEYDLKNMRIRRVGPDRKQFGGVSLELNSGSAFVSRNAATGKECEGNRNDQNHSAAARSVTPKVF